MRERVRGAVLAISDDTLTVRTMSDEALPVMLTTGTHYSDVLESSLDRVDSGSYIGTATKSKGNELVAHLVLRRPALGHTGLRPAHW